MNGTSKKWYSLFFPNPQDVPPGAGESGSLEAAARLKTAGGHGNGSAPAANGASLSEVYTAAQIRPPAHGFTVFKVMAMLESEHLRDLPFEARRKSVLMALEAVGVRLEEIVEDARRRQRALDLHDGVRQKMLDEYEARKATENSQVQAELDRHNAECMRRIRTNQEEVNRERERYQHWQACRARELQRISAAVETLLPPAKPAAGTLVELSALRQG